MGNPFLGVVLHAIGGLAAGSFYVPFRRVKNWAWESYWLVQGLLAWVVAPTVASALTVPGFADAIRSAPVDAVIKAYIFGALWGIGGLTFGLSMRYLGLSLGYAVALGFCAAFGTLIPPLFASKALELISTASGLTVLGGVVVCLAGIAVCGRAGVRKESELSDAEKKETIREFSFTKGLMVATFAGVMSACMAFAIAAGKPIADAAKAAGAADIYQNNPVFIVVMAGGFTANFLWCLLLNIRNKTAGDYVGRTGSGVGANYLFAGLAGVIWYLQFFFYGMGTTQMGRYDFSSWTIHMAFIITFSNLWGIYFREWQGVSKPTMRTVWAGLAILVLSTVVIGIGNAIAPK